MKNDVIIALDFPTGKETLKFLELFKDFPTKPMVKIGMELYYAEGPQIVRTLKEQGYRVFLDLKLHDIPTTVMRAMSVLRDLGADIVNLHAQGGSEMMKAAITGLTREDGTRPLLIAVTELTSTSPEMLKNEFLVSASMEETVTNFAKNAQNCGLDGVVCSPLEANKVKQNVGQNFITICPGVRFSDSAKGDQKRVMTPADAKSAGCDFIVMGRPITRAEDPVAAYKRALLDFI